MSLVPGLGIVKGMALTLRRFFEPKVTVMYPEDRARPAAQVPRPAAAPLRRVGHAQVRDLLPVRPGLPDRVHRHGRHRHPRPLPRPLGRPRDVRRAARGIGAAAVRPDRCPTRPTCRSPRSTPRQVDAILEEYDHDPARCSRSSRRPRRPPWVLDGRRASRIAEAIADSAEMGAEAQARHDKRPAVVGPLGGTGRSAARHIFT